MTPGLVRPAVRGPPVLVAYGSSRAHRGLAARFRDQRHDAADLTPHPVDEEEPTVTRTTDSRLPAGTIPGIIILAILAALAVAMLRSGSTTPTDAGAGSVARDQPDYSYAERREPDDPFALGPVDAPVGLVVFSDYQCPFCAQWNHETMPVMEQFANDGDLRISGGTSARAGLQTRRAHGVRRRPTGPTGSTTTHCSRRPDASRPRPVWKPSSNWPVSSAWT